MLYFTLPFVAIVAIAACGREVLRGLLAVNAVFLPFIEGDDGAESKSLCGRVDDAESAGFMGGNTVIVFKMIMCLYS